MRALNVSAALTLCTYAAAAPLTAISEPLPLLIWHGLGDKFDNEGLQSVGNLAEQINPGTYVHIIRLDDDGNNDRAATFFGNLTTQIEQVCEDIKNEPKLRTADKKSVRVDALGFSQGGQFLRGLLERCDDLSMRSLVTFGSQHNGIAEFQDCRTWDFLCKGSTALIKGNAWTEYVQNKVVPAQYYRTVNESTALASDEYLESSNFLADVNNERVLKNEKYAEKVASLEKFVMFVFEEDTTVIPKESGWFAEVNRTTGEVTPLQNRTIYTEDWLGLKKLDKKNGLVFKKTPGGHMQLNEKVLIKTFQDYFGAEKKFRSTMELGYELEEEIHGRWNRWRHEGQQEYMTNPSKDALR
ncbi:alpha/beta-hydrolase [Acrodontium crateriforme]|uniref:Palmitoyl-protein thioesterase 1 n=1 Tax=Acrodontium crateriforme TaxID=150365 RepID=A0AAQ3R503_9PEZI|nr:alpha/beta-hydrolase [Acrodontium crateriforme]